jgi:hypothetical protein
MPRFAALLAALLIALAPTSAALAAGKGSATKGAKAKATPTIAIPTPSAAPPADFGTLPPASNAPAPTPTPTKTPDNGETSRSTLWIVGVGLLVLFVAIGYTITRDARQTLPQLGIEDHRERDESMHRKQRDAKRKAREKAKRARAARKTTVKKRSR